MFPRCSKLFVFVAAILAVMTTFASAADAGWVTIKNDTNKAIVVQEVVTVNGKVVRGKPVKLLAGESFREFQSMAGVKSYEIVDAANTKMSIWSGNLNCKSDMQSFSVTTLQGKVGVTQLPEPKKP
ncbi:hypothetical protein VT84_18980 [Gemmata sp. SH-PL17]|uniref:hypothetical protein n=1 Tax=Gemmata sp. SH-PL17 TaxID=1630693 RepID=UPI00078D9E1E|nr:hypothetical protein [Gemmata sp. SH-PL17]AMV26491.1 hypothetical protein VT84_18980 [Gemmata sp. SH-PL17]